MLENRRSRNWRRMVDIINLETDRICKGTKYSVDCSTVLSRFNPNDICQSCVDKVPPNERHEYMEMRI